MTQEDKELLLKDLYARLPYGVIVDNPNPAGGAWDELISMDIPTGMVTLLYDGRTYKVEKIKPYLRLMSSMTKEEREKAKSFGNEKSMDYWGLIDFYNSIHVDYKGFISKGLALKAPEGMYNN